MSAGDVARIVLQPQMSAAPIARLAPIVDFPGSRRPQEQHEVVLADRPERSVDARR